MKRFALALAVAACGSSATAPQPGTDSPTPPGVDAPPPPAPTSSPSPSPATVIPTTGTCSDPVPAGAKAPPALPVYAMTCPVLAPSPALTTITSSDAARKFIVVQPSAPAAGETFPLVFAWHWLNGSAADLVDKLALQQVADLRRVIFVVPDAKGDLFYQWPMMSSHAQSRVDEELAFFDDMLACVGTTLPVQKHCVATFGVSAGALFTTQLGTLRAERLASFVSLSGGIGDPVRDFAPASRPVPALVLWGGPTDRFPSQTVAIFDFEKGSNKLAGALVNGKHPFVECIHNCGHDVPPFEDPAGTPKADAVYRFILDHPYWSSASPYASAKLPPAFPAWCAVGHGTAVPRSGSCP